MSLKRKEFIYSIYSELFNVLWDYIVDFLLVFFKFIAEIACCTVPLDMPFPFAVS